MKIFFRSLFSAHDGLDVTTFINHFLQHRTTTSIITSSISITIARSPIKRQADELRGFTTPTVWLSLLFCQIKHHEMWDLLFYAVLFEGLIVLHDFNGKHCFVIVAENNLQIDTPTHPKSTNNHKKNRS